MRFLCLTGLLALLSACSSIPSANTVDTLHSSPALSKLLESEASKLLQYGALSAWHAEGRAPNDERLNLHSQLRPQLDQLQQQLIERLLAKSLAERGGDPQHALALIRASTRLCEAS